MRELREDIKMIMHKTGYNPIVKYKSQNDVYEWIQKIVDLAVKEQLRTMLLNIESDHFLWGCAKKKQCINCGASWYEFADRCTCGSDKFEDYVCIDKRLIIKWLKDLDKNGK